jgi:radical SAM superfamily enzyme YgiQ (UPF0313 family)
MAYFISAGRRSQTRTKMPAQLIAELDALCQRGWKDMVFIVADNFIGNKARTKTLLHALIEWRKRTPRVPPAKRR